MTVLEVPAESGSDDVAAFAVELRRALEANAPTVVDLSHTPRLSSGAVAALLETASLARERQQAFVLVAPPGSFARQVLALLKVSPSLVVTATLPGALRRLTAASGGHGAANVEPAPPGDRRDPQARPPHRLRRRLRPSSPDGGLVDPAQAVGS